MIKDLLKHGTNQKMLLFAINNACNNRCKMCSIWKMKEKKIVRYDDAKKALTKFYNNGFRLLQLTGGEPLLNPDFFKILGFAKNIGYTVFFPSNGTLINKEIAEKLSKSKVDQVSVSLHHFNPKIFDEISGHENILDKTLNAITYLRQANVPVSVLCTITRDNYRDLEGIVDFFNSLKVSVSFSTPVSIDKTTYALGGKTAEFDNNELKNAINELISLKKRYRNILNCREFLEDVLDFLQNRKSAHTCLGGKKIFYLDWNMKVFPCMYKGEGIKIDKFFDSHREEDKRCEECIQQCFREPSIFMGSNYGAVKVFMEELPTYLKFIRNSYLKGL